MLITVVMSDNFPARVNDWSPCTCYDILFLNVEITSIRGKQPLFYFNFLYTGASFSRNLVSSNSLSLNIVISIGSFNNFSRNKEI